MGDSAVSAVRSAAKWAAVCSRAAVPKVELVATEALSLVRLSLVVDVVVGEPAEGAADVLGEEGSA